MSQALNQLRAMVSLPEYYPANSGPPDGRPRVDGVIGLESEPPWKVVVQIRDRASADSLRWNLDLILDQRGADMAVLPGGASGLLVRGYNGKEANRLVTRIDPGVVSLVAELRGHERQTARNWASGRRTTRSVGWSTRRRRSVTLALLTDEELDSLEKRAGDGEIAGPGRPGGSNVPSPQPVKCCGFLKGPRLREALSVATIALKISSRNARVAALQKPLGSPCAPASI